MSITILSDDSNTSDQDFLKREFDNSSDNDCDNNLLQVDQCIDLTEVCDELPQNTSFSSGCSTAPGCNLPTAIKRKRKKENTLKKANNLNEESTSNDKTMQHTIILDDDTVNVLPAPIFTINSEYDNDRLFDTLHSGLRVKSLGTVDCQNERALSTCSLKPSEKSSPRHLQSPNLDAVEIHEMNSVSPSSSVPSEKSPPAKRGRKKRFSNTDKENKNKQKADEKAAQVAARLESKAFRPGECIKYMYLEVSSELASRTIFADVTTTLAEHGAHVSITNVSTLDPRVVSWSRRLPVQHLAALDGQLGLSSRVEPCSACMLVLEASEVCAMVQARRLTATVRGAQPSHAHTFTLLICNTREYMKSAGKKQRGTNRQNVMSEIDLDLALTDLLVETGCSCVRVESREQLAQVLLQHSKAIAEQPYKAARHEIDQMADFYMRGDKKNCIAIDKDGRGLKRVWQQMLARLPLSSLEAARTIAQLHPSPLHLAQSVKEDAATLASAGVRRAAVPGARARKLGPELARRIAILFSSTDGEQILD